MPATRGGAGWGRVALALALAVAATLGCAPACDTGEASEPQRFTGGTTKNGIYETSGWSGGWLHFPGGKRYDLVHHLGFSPAVVDVSLSFSESGVGDRVQADTAAKAAGNSGEAEIVNDEYVRIKNDTCAEFWVRVVAFGDMREPGDGGAEAQAPGADASPE
jgi:hypothetical protein